VSIPPLALYTPLSGRVGEGEASGGSGWRRGGRGSGSSAVGGGEGGCRSPPVVAFRSRAIAAFRGRAFSPVGVGTALVTCNKHEDRQLILLNISVYTLFVLFSIFVTQEIWYTITIISHAISTSI
jgi:hypothetical protein